VRGRYCLLRCPFIRSKGLRELVSPSLVRASRRDALTIAASSVAQEVEEKVFAALLTEPLFDDKVMQCLQPRACLQPRIKDKSFDEQVQVRAPSQSMSVVNEGGEPQCLCELWRKGG
jgi:hypothetical protein